MALISKSCEYGLRATLFLAAAKKGVPIAIRTISRELHISFHFLTKTLQKLTQKGIVVSSKGPGGGVALAKPANRISLMDVIQAIDGNAMFQRCILGLEMCGKTKPCPLHKSWARERAALASLFRKTTLAKISGRVAGDQMQRKSSKTE